MRQIDDAIIARTLPGWILDPVGADDHTIAQVPDQWRQVVLAGDPRARVEAALALWNHSFLELVPQFADMLRTCCVDVRAYITSAEPILTYVIQTDHGQYVSWIGHDPRSFEYPLYWESFPEPLQVFLREVHAGFISVEWILFGLARPAQMETLASLAGLPEGIPDWDAGSEIPSTRLLVITKDSGALHYCVSPDLPVGKIALVYEGDCDPYDVGTELDELMLSRLELRV